MSQRQQMEKVSQRYRQSRSHASRPYSDRCLGREHSHAKRGNEK
ncbi:hypothetical protein [Desulfonema magnum]|nr:hypothetical protein [Desulfonema magnum]